MARVKRLYGPWSRAMLGELRRRGELKAEALVAWLGERGLPVDRTLVSHWTAGRSHLPADLLPRLAQFCGRPELVFGEYLRAAGCELVHLPGGEVPDRDLVELMLEAGASLGRLHRALIVAIAPDSPGGKAITAAECGELRRRLDAFIHQLVELRALLARREAGPPG